MKTAFESFSAKKSIKKIHSIESEIATESVVKQTKKKMLSRSLNATSRLKKRERTQNWAFEEKRFLLELCKRDMNIIENKRLDADLTALKNRAWKSVHEEFCKVFGNERNCNRLKEQWRRMKGKFVLK